MVTSRLKLRMVSGRVVYCPQCFQSCCRLDHSAHQEDKVRVFRWTPFSHLEELNYADDLRLALLSHNNSKIQETTGRLNFFALNQMQVGVNTRGKKTEVMALNTTNSAVQVENEDLPYTDKFLTKRNSSPKTFKYL